MTHTEAFPLDAPMLPPLVLPPPFGPRIVRALVIALAVIFQVFTAGWSLILNGAEGELAGAARALLRHHEWIPLAADGSSEAPLALWLTQASMALFGVNEFAARLPIALAGVAAVWFTFRLGELYGGIWRGFVAGMLLLCSPGMFTVGRTLTPAPLTATLITATFYFLSRGFERRPSRRQWYLLAWVMFGLTYFAGGWLAAAVPAGTVLLLSAFFREARMRFPALITWEGALVVTLTLAGALLTVHGRSGAWLSAWNSSDGIAPGMPPGIFAGWQWALLFPWSILLLPAAGAVVARLVKFRPLEWPEAFPLAWAVVGFTVAMNDPARHLSDGAELWPAVALWGAFTLETMPRKHFLRWTGVVLALAGVGLILVGRLPSLLVMARPAEAESIRAIPDFFGLSISSVAFIAVLAFELFGAAAFWLEWNHRRRFALMALFGAMIPAGYAFADASAKLAPYFSFADFAHCIDGTVDGEPHVAVDIPLPASSSLQFYLEAPSAPAPSNPAELAALWNSPKRVYVICRRARLPEWSRAFQGHYRIACESGANVLVTNSVNNRMAP